MEPNRLRDESPPDVIRERDPDQLTYDPDTLAPSWQGQPLLAAPGVSPGRRGIDRRAIGYGLGAGLLVLLPQAVMWSLVGLLTLFLLPILSVAFGLLAGWAVPGVRGWLGFAIGLVAAAIVARVISAISQPDLYYASSLLGAMVTDAIGLVVLASVGFAIGVVVRGPNR